MWKGVFNRFWALFRAPERTHSTRLSPVWEPQTEAGAVRPPVSVGERSQEGTALRGGITPWTRTKNKVII